MDQHGFLGVNPGQVADDVTSRVVGDWGVRVIGGLFGLRTAPDPAAAHEALVLDDQAVHDVRIYHHIEDHGGHIGRLRCRIGTQVSGCGIFRCVDRNGGVKWVDAGARVGDSQAV